MVKKLSLQEYLSLGYLFLVVLGVVSESVFYGLLRVSYLQYTSILDVLLSPISILADNWILLIFFASICAIVFLLSRMEGKYKEKKWFKVLYQSNIKVKNNEFRNKTDIVISLLFYMIFAMIIGFRIGNGAKYKKLLENGEFESNYTLVFKDDKQINVKKVGQNSLYVFYVQEGEKVVTATPILENIKQIKRILKDK